MKKRIALFLLLLGCLSAPAHAAPVHVVASFSILADMAKNVGDDDVEVISLVKPDADAHTYEPTPEDAKTIAKADIVLVNGLGYEGWIERLIKASGFKGRVVVASQGIRARLMNENGRNVTDPHAWQDLQNAHVYVRNIKAALARFAPQYVNDFRANGARYDAQIDALDKEIRNQLAVVPEKQRTVISSHEAFGYFGDAYDITFFAPTGISSDAEPSAASVALLVDQVKNLGIKKVFLENMSSPRLIEQIAKDAGAELGGTLYSDALSGPKGPAPTYLDIFRNNVPKLKAAMLY